jgi:hypothetical protein
MRWSNEQRAFAVEAYFSKKEVSLPHPVHATIEKTLDMVFFLQSVSFQVLSM